MILSKKRNPRIKKNQNNRKKFEIITTFYQVKCYESFRWTNNHYK